MTPNTDAPDVADDDADYSESLRNQKINKNNITPNTNAPNYDYPLADDDDYSASPDPIILDSSIECKIDPKSMLKPKNVKMTVTNANAATDNAYPNAINTSPHAPNAATDPDTASSTT